MHKEDKTMKSVYESIMTGLNEAIEDAKTKDKKLSRRQVTSMCELFDQYWRKGYIQGYIQGYTITGKCYNVAYENILQNLCKELNISKEEVEEQMKLYW